MTEKEKERIENKGWIIGFVLKSLHIDSTNSEYEDLLQEGRVALCVSSKRYNDELGIKYDTYAISYVRGYLMKYISYNRLIKPSRKAADIYRMSRNTKQYTDEEIMEKCNCTREDIKSLDRLELGSLDRDIDDGTNAYDLIDDGTDFVNVLADNDVADRIMKVVMDVLNKCKPLHRDLYLAYLQENLTDCKGLKKKVAEDYNINYSRVSRIITCTSKKVRKEIERRNRIWQVKRS